jgi:HD-GYP domain-containing protein (c-di-GMP phosphodiesterase class II)
MNKEANGFFNKKTLYKLILAAVCLALNLILSFAARRIAIFEFRVYLDCVGTALATMLGGLLPGVIVGFATNVINSFYSSDITMYFGTVSVVFALFVRLFFIRGYFAKIYKRFLSSVAVAAVCGIIGGVLTWLIYGLNIGTEISAPLANKLVEAWRVSPFSAQILSEIFINLVDKTVVIFIAYLFFRVCPKKIKIALATADPLHDDDYSKVSVRRFFRSLSSYVVGFMLLFDVLLCSTVAGVAYYMYRETNIKKYSLICDNAVHIAIRAIDAEKVPRYEAERKAAFDEYAEALPGEAAADPDSYPELFEDYWDFAHARYSPDYIKTEAELVEILNVYEELEYLYVYHITEDGCHVVFDADPEAPGAFVPFDESFEKLIPDLIAGKDIDPIVTDDTYGWLLTVYRPLYNEAGKCVCYVCGDISMEGLRIDQMIFIVKVVTLVIGLSVIALITILNIFDKRTVVPLKKISSAASEFAFDSEEGQQSSIDRIRGLQIKSCSEIEQLYDSLKKLATDSVEYIDELENNAKTIARMQEGIIIDFANMVESRDKCTGDHIKNTSFYVGCIAEQLRREGEFSDVLNDDYVSSIVRCAPLHDIGKIKISDIILNKPGKLTDEEYEIMKTHTTEGYQILKETIANTLDNGYLKEAINMAYCHHEKWDGSGYPRGLKGEEIPLSARIMAVADVFDALVSKRSYKEPFSFDEAVSIIERESGTHFDPTVVRAFMNVKNKIKL